MGGLPCSGFDNDVNYVQPLQSSAVLKTHTRLGAGGPDYQGQIVLARNPTEPDYPYQIGQSLLAEIGFPGLDKIDRASLSRDRQSEGVEVGRLGDQLLRLPVSMG